MGRKNINPQLMTGTFARKGRGFDPEENRFFYSPRIKDESAVSLV
jgi:hypothetical protein